MPQSDGHHFVCANDDEYHAQREQYDIKKFHGRAKVRRMQEPRGRGDAEDLIRKKAKKILPPADIADLADFFLPCKKIALICAICVICGRKKSRENEFNSVFDIEHTARRLADHVR